MTVTILVHGGEEQSLIGSVKWILNQIKLLRYEQDDIEVVFMVTSQNKSGSRKHEGTPLVKVKYFKPNTSPNDMVSESIVDAIGSVIMIADIDAFFKQDDLVQAVHQLMDKSTGLVIGPKHIVFRKPELRLYIEWPQCIKCCLITRCAIENKYIHGKWGKMHRFDIARGFPGMKKTNLLTKLKLIWKWVSGI